MTANAALDQPQLAHSVPLRDQHHTSAAAQLLTLSAFHPMKYTLAVILVSLLTGCRSHDAVLNQQALGTWTRTEFDVPVRIDGCFVSWKTTPGRMTFLADGGWSSFYGDTNGCDKYAGTWFIKSGTLVLTATNSDGAETCDVSKLKIVHLDKQRLVYDTQPPKAVRVTWFH